MKMTNLEYLQAYVDWKDKVNTEDVDTPERFDAYLQDRENAQVLEAAREEFSSVMDGLTGTTVEWRSSEVREVFLPVAEALGLDTTWWKANKKLEALATRPTVFADDHGDK